MADIVLVEGNNELNIQMTPIPPPVANLYGMVTDIYTGAPLAGVLVTIDGITTMTNASGEYMFAGLIPRSYTITFEKEGYETVFR